MLKFEKRKKGYSVLNENQVREIKKMLKDKVYQKEIVRIFNVSQATISAISVGKNWKHITI